MNWKTLQQPLSDHRLFVAAGHLYFLVMLLFAVVYFEERMLAMDTAYYAYKLIVHEEFYTGHHRYISYIPQVFPLLVMKLGGSLKAVLIAYSAGFILFYYAAYAVIVHLFRNPKAGILLAFALGLTVRYKFYGPVGEVVLSMVPLCLLSGWMSKPKDVFAKWPAWLDVAIGLLLGCFLLTGHPFITISTALSIGFLLLWQKEWRNPRFWLITLGTGILLFVKFVLEEHNDYEAERASRMEEAWTVLSNLSDYHISSVLLRYFDMQYHLPFIVFIICLISLVFAKRIGIALYALLSFLVVLAVVVIMHAYLTSHIFIMLDGYLAHLGLFWGLPIAMYWVSEKRPWMLLLIGGLLVFSLARIHDSRAFFAKRLAYLRTVLAEETSEEQPKAVAYFTDMNYEKLWIGWAMGVETLLISSLDGPAGTRNIYLADKPGDLEGRFDEPDLFLSVPFGPEFVKRKDLPKQYFALPLKPYHEIKLPH